ncbi:hypothetical protein TruAng_000888 [Truncatella angustata]|nr:hypothetical protein TruAng_000888 [Truncatella angustata]
MDHGFLNESLNQVTSLTLAEPEASEVAENLPKGPYNPFRNQPEETEKDALYHFMVTGAPLSQQIPPHFGALSHPDPNSGLYRLRFIKGDGNGMRRPEEHTTQYEHHKYNQRLNPRPDRVGNYGFGMCGTLDSVRTENDMKAGALAQFPNIGGLVTSAPFKASGIRFIFKEVDQTSLIFTMFLKHPELLQSLLEELFTWIVEQEFGYFATNKMDFLKCDKSPEELQALVAAGKLTRECVDDIRVPKFLHIGRVRYPTQMAPSFGGSPDVFWPPQVWSADEEGLQTHQDLFNDHGFQNIIPYTRKRSEMPFYQHCGALQKLLRTCFLHPRNFNFLTITSLDALNVTSVMAIIEGCPKLRGLCIYSCPLISLHEVREIIQAIGKTNELRIKARKPLLDLDIAPRFHQGPIDGRNGSYGVTHSDPTLYCDWNTDVGRAIGASIVSLMRQAEKAGIQLCQPGKAFRLWLDKLPLDLYQAENLCVTAANFLQNEKKRWDWAHEVYCSPGDERPRAALVKRFDETVALDLLAAALARPIRHKIDYVEQHKFTCTTCNERLPGEFFRRISASRPPNSIKCEGCELGFQQQYEPGNNQLEMNRIVVNMWLDAPEKSLDWISGDSFEAKRRRDVLINEAKKLPTSETLLIRAEKLDDKRQDVVDEMYDCYDWIRKKDLDGKRKNIERKIEALRVRAGFQARPKPGLASEYDWDYRRRAYFWTGQLESGNVQNNGPYENVTLLTLKKHFTMLH